jgi:hypothetical protein
MKYPKEFIEKAKSLYPDWTDLHIALQRGDKSVLGMLERTRGFTMLPDEIIKAFKNNRSSKVLEAAISAEKRRKLYLEAINLVDNWVARQNT